MNESLRQTSRAWVPIALMAILLFYPLSFGPACWLVSRTTSVNASWRPVLYLPLLPVYQRCPELIVSCVDAFVNFGAGKNIVIIRENDIAIWDRNGLM
ncbi:MAG: hypothetical protein JWN70_2562 [Planctomycetaceae bacterium]|nr:hypothetical protein [Planctomycetaceae bacterium]